MKKNFGLIGKTLGHSISDKIHQMIMAHNGWEGTYNYFELDERDLFQAIKGAKALGIKGLNVTIPYKEKVIPCLDRLSDEALAIGAVNTLHFSKGECLGYNTDYNGFKHTLEALNVTITDKHFVVLGCGGAAKSVVKCLLDEGAKEITLLVRSPESVKGFLKEQACITYDSFKKNPRGQCLINATPVGMYPKNFEMPLESTSLLGFEYCIDLIYNPAETALMKAARSHGVSASNGLYMLIGQAIAAQEIWQGKISKPDTLKWIYKEMHLTLY